jgi:signal transduction histidine kinase
MITILRRGALVLVFSSMWTITYVFHGFVSWNIKLSVSAAWPLLLVWSLMAELRNVERSGPKAWSAWCYPAALGLGALVLDHFLWPYPMAAPGVFPHLILIDGGIALALPALVILLARALNWKLRIEQAPVQHWLALVAAVLFVLPPYMSFAKSGQLALLTFASVAVWLSELPKLEARRPAHKWRIRLLAFALAAAGFAAGQALSTFALAHTPRLVGPMTMSLRTLVYICSWPIVLSLGLAFTVVCASSADGLAWALRRSSSVRRRMFALAILCSALAFVLSELPLERLYFVSEAVKAEVRPAVQLILLGAIVWVFSVTFSSELSRSLERSVQAMSEIRRGNLEVALDDSGRDEVAAVARSFNQMVARLREAEFLEKINTELRSRSARLAQTLDALRAAQAELIRSERMASVATLVKGIAHELNNPINYIAGNMAPLRRYGEFLSHVAAELSDGRARSVDELQALTRLGEHKDLRFVSEDLASLTADIAEGARRAQLIISDLQNLTSAAQRGIEQLDLHRVVRQTVSLLAPRVPAGVRLEAELSPVAALPARAGQIEQVLVNLAANALHAVGEKGSVKIYVGRDGEEAVIRVIDDGPGMTAAVRNQAFEPFFTTRPAGEGSGLGLAIVAAIIRGHSGTVKCTSQPGVGTEVEVRLPLEGDLVTQHELFSESNLAQPGVL